MGLYSHIFWQIINDWFDEKILSSLVHVEITKILSHFFHKNFVKATVLLKKLLKSWFDEIFLRWEWIFHFSTLCIENKILSHEKYFVKPTYSMINSWKRWFHGIFFEKNSVRRQHSVEKKRNSLSPKNNFVKSTLQ